jgi:hypothetical protein
MKILVGLLAFLNALPLLAQTSLEERLSKLEEKVEEAEIERSFQRLKFSGTFIGLAEALNSHFKDPANASEERNHGILSGMHLGLNFDYNISDKIDFFSTLGMGKVLNNDGRDGLSQASYRSNQGSYGYAGSAAKFDVAYLRWKMPDENLSLAFGRMTTRGGPPLHQLDGLDRAGTYPRFGYNAIFDGLAAIYNFKSFLPENLELKSRIFYTPYFFLDSSDRTATAEHTYEDPPGTIKSDGEVDRRSDQIALLNEFSWNNQWVAKKINVYSMFWYYDNFYDEDYQTAGNQRIEYYRATNHTLYLGFERILNSGLNFSWSHLRVNAKLDRSTSERSDSSLLNLNYKTEKGIVLGVEKIFTDKTFYLDEYAYLQFNEFYQRSNNNGQHYFVAFPLEHQQILRLGLYDYQAGKAPANLYNTTEKTQNFYVMYRVDF